MKIQASNIIAKANAIYYCRKKTVWDVYGLFFEPLPILVLRNNNDKHTKYDPRKDWHSTLSWHKGANLTIAVTLTISILQKWGLFRGLSSRQRDNVIKRTVREVPRIVEALCHYLWGEDIRRIRAVRTSSKQYWPMIIKLARAVGKISRLKGNKTPNPMFGSKILHFLMPEFFPVWDNAVIDKKCLRTLERQHCPEAIARKLNDKSEREYADYLHLFMTDFAQAKNAKYLSAELACIGCIHPGARKQIQDILRYHYDDVSTTVFEICLMGKCL